MDPSDTDGGEEGRPDDYIYINYKQIQKKASNRKSFRAHYLDNGHISLYITKKGHIDRLLFSPKSLISQICSCVVKPPTQW